MALLLPPLLLEPNTQRNQVLIPSLSHTNSSFLHRKPTPMALRFQFQFHSHTSRRTSLVLYSGSILAFREAIFNGGTANAFDFGVTAPDQTVEEAEGVIKGHAQSLLRVKDLLEPETLKDAQKALRKSSSYLKQDLYTIIQAKPGSARPQLRKLYSILFNSVTRLDYAARDKDMTRVRECYDNIVLALDEILSRL